MEEISNDLVGEDTNEAPLEAIIDKLTGREVQEIIVRLKKNKSVGENSVVAEILKEVRDTLELNIYSYEVVALIVT